VNAVFEKYPLKVSLTDPFFKIYFENDVKKYKTVKMVENGVLGPVFLLFIIHFAAIMEKLFWSRVVAIRESTNTPQHTNLSSYRKKTCQLSGVRMIHCAQQREQGFSS
jgi:hypothetical protein